MRDGGMVIMPDYLEKQIVLGGTGSAMPCTINFRGVLHHSMSAYYESLIQILRDTHPEALLYEQLEGTEEKGETQEEEEEEAGCTLTCTLTLTLTPPVAGGRAGRV